MNRLLKKHFILCVTFHFYFMPHSLTTCFYISSQGQVECEFLCNLTCSWEGGREGLMMLLVRGPTRGLHTGLCLYLCTTAVEEKSFLTTLLFFKHNFTQKLINQVKLIKLLCISKGVAVLHRHTNANCIYISLLFARISNKTEFFTVLRF